MGLALSGQQPGRAANSTLKTDLRSKKPAQAVCGKCDLKDRISVGANRCWQDNPGKSKILIYGCGNIDYATYAGIQFIDTLRIVQGGLFHPVSPLETGRPVQPSFHGPAPCGRDAGRSDITGLHPMFRPLCAHGLFSHQNACEATAIKPLNGNRQLICMFQLVRTSGKQAVSKASSI